jgi:hypothetical protein
MGFGAAALQGARDMRELETRRFDWGDFLALELAVGLGLLWDREARFWRYQEMVPWPPGGAWHAWLDLSARVMLLVAMAIGICRLRRPRPVRRILRRQYGFLACAGVIGAFCYSHLNDYTLFRSETFEVAFQDLATERIGIQEMGCVVFGAWLLLFVTGSGRCEWSWVDRAGRLLGWYWVIAGLVFNYM